MIPYLLIITSIILAANDKGTVTIISCFRYERKQEIKLNPRLTLFTYSPSVVTNPLEFILNIL